MGPLVIRMAYMPIGEIWDVTPLDRRTDGRKVERKAIFCLGRIWFRNIKTIITKTETRVTVPQWSRLDQASSWVRVDRQARSMKIFHFHIFQFYIFWKLLLTPAHSPRLLVGGSGGPRPHRLLVIFSSKHLSSANFFPNKPNCKYMSKLKSW